MKEKIKRIKEMCKNPRKKALLQLMTWIIVFLIFYIIVILIPHPKPKYVNSSNSNEVDFPSNYFDRKSFEFTYTFSYQEEITEMLGTYFENNYYFTYLGEEYYSSLGNIYKVDSVQKELIQIDAFLLNLSINELNNEALNNIILNSKVVEEKEYKNGKKITSYEYMEDEKTIELTVTITDNDIIEILIDYNDYYALYPNLEVKLEYQEINNLSSYSKNYSDYRVVVEEE